VLCVTDCTAYYLSYDRILKLNYYTLFWDLIYLKTCKENEMSRSLESLPFLRKWIIIIIVLSSDINVINC
jgi:hypothetical protein